MKRKIKVFPFGYDPMIAGCKCVEDLAKLGIEGCDITDILKAEKLGKQATVIELEEGEEIPVQHRFLWHVEITEKT
jgi:hypothetical protein